MILGYLAHSDQRATNTVTLKFNQHQNEKQKQNCILTLNKV